MRKRKKHRWPAASEGRLVGSGDLSLPVLCQSVWAKWTNYWNSPQPRKDAASFCTFLVIVFLINATVAANVQVPTGSMKDTIREHERFFVRKLGYGVQNPLSSRHKIKVNKDALFQWKDLARGDIVMFVPPERTGVDEKYVKRLVALPGESVEIRAGVGVLVEGQLLDEPYLLEPPRYSMARQVVPDGKAFVLGDNRNNSYDSHAWGFLRLESIQGVVAFRYWPFSRLGFLGLNAGRNNRILFAGVCSLLAGCVCWQMLKHRSKIADKHGSESHAPQ